jgi:hypothetical protein
MSKFNDFAGKWQNKIDDFAVKTHGMLFFRPFTAYI